ncbi:MAG TPA: hypothetical protein VK912_18760 [Longimicrobiales bacterium]|nr:hypothetical protein [Longimicrobiales bacterium]
MRRFRAAGDAGGGGQCALGLYLWQDGEHADAIRRRVSEMRSPPPPLDRAPDAALDALTTS